MSNKVVKNATPHHGSSVPNWRRGAVLAIVGPDASGKTTISSELKRRFTSTALIERAHLGSPPETPVTAFLRLSIRACRRLLKIATGRRNSTVEEFPILQSMFLVLLGLERRALLRRIARNTHAGYLFVTDRYPSREWGAASGPSIGPSPRCIIRWLAMLELRIYSGIPNPDMLVRLSVSEAETIRRNALRHPPKPEAVIRSSHEAAAKIRFDDVPELTVDNTRPLDDVIHAVSLFVNQCVG